MLKMPKNHVKHISSQNENYNLVQKFLKNFMENNTHLFIEK